MKLHKRVHILKASDILLAILFAIAAAELVNIYEFPKGNFGYAIRFVIAGIVAGFWVKTNLPRKEINFTFETIVNIIKRDLCPKIKENHTVDVIIGIAGGKYVGGAIIASLLASNKIGLDKACIYLEFPRDPLHGGEVYWDQSDDIFQCATTKIIDIFGSPKAKKRIGILLVDDISFDGNTLHQTVIRLREKLNNYNFESEIRVALIATKREAYQCLPKEFNIDSKIFWKKQFIGMKEPIEKGTKAIFPWVV
jgi:hypoxanthine phosphoribosyltransferase